MVLKKPAYSTDKYYALAKNQPVSKARNTGGGYEKTGPKTYAQSVQQYDRQALNANYAALKQQYPDLPGLYDRRGGNDIQSVVRNSMAMGAGPAYQPPPASFGRTGGGGSGGGYGGGGGGVDPALGAQAQMDYLNDLLNGGSWTVDASAYAAPSMDAARAANQALRGNVAQASAQDLAAANASYGALDQWLAANQTNPYSNVQLQDARVAPAQNAYLASQGMTPMNDVAANPEDVGAKAAFQNVLSLLGAGQQSWNQSRGAESQMARTYAQNEIGAMDNAFLAQIGMRDADIGMQEARMQMEMDQQRREAQMGLDKEKRSLQVQLAELVGLGARPPGQPGARPGFVTTPQDPHGWASIAAGAEWDRLHGGG